MKLIRLPVKSTSRFPINQFPALDNKLYGDFRIVDILATRLVPFRFPFREIRFQSRRLHPINRLQLDDFVNNKHSTLYQMPLCPSSQHLSENQIVGVRIMSATRGQKNLVAQACFEFRRAAVPANRMEFGHAAFVENDRIVSFDCDESVVECPVMQCAQADSVFQFICSALVVNRDDVSRVHEVKLNSADCTAVSRRALFDFTRQQRFMANDLNGHACRFF